MAAVIKVIFIAMHAAGSLGESLWCFRSGDSIHD